jgi:hypothetical protein
MSQRNDQESLAAVQRDYRNDSGAGVSTEEDSGDLLVANLRAFSLASRCS